MEKLAFACDHGAIELKDAVMKEMIAEGYEIEDLGTYDKESVDYPIYGKKCAEYVASGKADKGVVFCGSGIGISIAANKVKGIRCALITGEEYAKLAAEHNNANMIALGGRFTETEEAIRYIKIWLSTPFGEGRHARRVEMLNEM